eukprot:CAMPEP_0116969370 /NCGR_PEP_ID=MMETSP0467-20121206/51888_1 /TAXON_ID=283647 /ORGANISM="Mesodinium pulex, Strain SPMC105" /LENGTH=36 /DNA_ID= /DNA_START= /DNA_END= /DNA_ORIENTATION=
MANMEKCGGDATSTFPIHKRKNGCFRSSSQSSVDGL